MMCTLALVVTALSFSCVDAFTTVSVSQQHSPRMVKTASSPPPLSPLRALIYGWDGGDVEGDAASSPYLDVGSSDQACSPVGTAVAEALSYDSQRAGHLARLAVAFSPPERALSLDKLERVDVICVREDHIEIEAILCEAGDSCVSLHVPIKFPRDCGSEHALNDQLLEGCVMKNLDELDAEAGSLLKVAAEATKTEAQSQEDFEELCVLNEKVTEFPTWWVPPECDATLTADCEAIRTLLNDAEFQPDVNALAQDSLRKLADGEDYKVLQAKVAIVGPAGLCFKVRAEHELAGRNDRPIHILDVALPFGETLTTGSDLRAAVLGAVSSADGS